MNKRRIVISKIRKKLYKIQSKIYWRNDDKGLRQHFKNIISDFIWDKLNDEIKIKYITIQIRNKKMNKRKRIGSRVRDRVCGRVGERVWMKVRERVWNKVDIIL